MSEGQPRDVAREITDALAAGDIRALAALAIDLAGEVKALQRDAAATSRRRKVDADRKRGTTPRNSAEVSGDPRKSAEVGGEMRSEAGPPSPPSPSLSSPTPLINPSSPTPPSQQQPQRAREALGVEGTPLRDAISELANRLGGESARPTVEDFIGQAPAASRFAWTRSLIAALDPLGAQRVEPDVLRLAMEDFLIADRVKWPWVARVFRAFVDDVTRPKVEKRRRGDAGDPTDELARWASETDAKERQAMAS